MTGQDGQSAAKPSLHRRLAGFRSEAVGAGWMGFADALPIRHVSAVSELFQGVGRDRPSGSHRGRVAGSTRIMSFAST